MSYAQLRVEYVKFWVDYARFRVEYAQIHAEYVFDKNLAVNRCCFLLRQALLWSECRINIENYREKMHLENYWYSDPVPKYELPDQMIVNFLSF